MATALTLQDLIDVGAKVHSLQGIVGFLKGRAQDLTPDLGEALHEQGIKGLSAGNTDSSSTAFYLAAYVYEVLGQPGKALEEQFNLAQARYGAASSRDDYAEVIKTASKIVSEAAARQDINIRRDALGLIADCALFASEADSNVSADASRSWLLTAMRFVTYLGDALGGQKITEAQLARLAYLAALIRNRSVQTPWLEPVEEAEAYELMRRLSQLADEYIPADYEHPDTTKSAFIAKELADLANDYVQAGPDASG